LREEADRLAPFRHQVHGAFVEREEAIRAKPVAFVGDGAIGEVSAGIEQSEPGLDRRRFTTTFSLFTRLRMVCAISADGILYPCDRTQTSSQSAGNASATTSALANSACATLLAPRRRP
jgi:hypothetical protein